MLFSDYGERKATFHPNRKYIKNDKRYAHWSNKHTRCVMISRFEETIYEPRKDHAPVTTFFKESTI
jgi:adenine-specific DNA methylase